MEYVILFVISASWFGFMAFARLLFRMSMFNICSSAIKALGISVIVLIVITSTIAIYVAWIDPPMAALRISWEKSLRLIAKGWVPLAIVIWFYRYVKPVVNQLRIKNSEARHSSTVQNRQRISN